MMTDVMLDMETAGTEPGSAILTLAAYGFSAEAGPTDIPDDLSGAAPLFYERVRLQSCLDAGLVVDGPTLEWWSEQSEEARREAFRATPRFALAYVLDRLRRWFDEHVPVRDVMVWGHGATFDPVLLASAHRACRLSVPWGHREVRDTRTCFDDAGLKSADRTVNPHPHHAAWDAICQARDVQAARSWLAELRRRAGLGDGAFGGQ